jgi:hypothetical protein
VLTLISAREYYYCTDCGSLFDVEEGKHEGDYCNEECIAVDFNEYYNPEILFDYEWEFAKNEFPHALIKKTNKIELIAEYYDGYTIMIFPTEREIKLISRTDIVTKNLPAEVCDTILQDLAD